MKLIWIPLPRDVSGGQRDKKKPDVLQVCTLFYLIKEEDEINVDRLQNFQKQLSMTLVY